MESKYRKELVKDIVRWDINNWRKMLFYWYPYIKNLGPTVRVLEIGAMDGGLSLFFAMKGCQVICSDQNGPTVLARKIHKKYGVTNRIDYQVIDAKNITYPEDSFDIVCFKSVLGGIGKGNSFDNQKQAVDEMHRVLKTGGKLLFAENLHGSVIHRYLRDCFVKRGDTWRYMTREQLLELLYLFNDVSLNCYGCLAAMGRNEFQKSLLHYVDEILDCILCDDYKYIAFGCAVK